MYHRVRYSIVGISSVTPFKYTESEAYEVANEIRASGGTAQVEDRDGIVSPKRHQTVIYSGKHDSPGKVAARAVAYARLSRKDFYGKTHIVIASRECGDIQYLLARGVEPEHILACDIDPIALTSAEKYRVRVSPDDIETTVGQELERSCHGNKVASINVDLCSSMVKGLPIITKVCGHIDYPWKGHLFYTFERAFDQRFHLHSTKERIEFLSRHLNEHADWCKSPVDMLKDSFEYVSFTRTSVGSPMMMVNLSIPKEKRP